MHVVARLALAQGLRGNGVRSQVEWERFLASDLGQQDAHGIIAQLTLHANAS